MICDNCDENKVISVTAKCKDMCDITYADGTNYDGYVPANLGIGEGDYIELTFCTDCRMLL